MSTEFKIREDIRAYSVVVVPASQDENRVRKQPDTNAVIAAFLKSGETLAVILEKPRVWTKAYPYENAGFLWVYVYAGRAKSAAPNGKMDTTKETEVLGWTAAGELDKNGAVSKWYLEPADISKLTK